MKYLILAAQLLGTAAVLGLFTAAAAGMIALLLFLTLMCCMLALPSIAMWLFKLPARLIGRVLPR